MHNENEMQNSKFKIQNLEFGQSMQNRDVSRGTYRAVLMEERASSAR